VPVFLHCEFFEFEPAFKIWLSFNHKPRIRGTDHAIWRRIRLIPFDVTIPEDERDQELIEKLKTELPGILAWVVEGCQMWLEHGLKAPKAVMAATREYREESDTLGGFINECCELGPDCKVTKADLYGAYVDWANKSGEHPVSKKQLAALLLEKGFNEDRNKGARLWTGIAVNG
jgi:putative DNA primase/helicase